MKKIALLGGLGPESTLLYYRGIIDAFTATFEETGYPEILIDSVDLKRVVAMADEDRWAELADEFARRFESMRNGGAEIGAMCSNTPHKIFDAVQQKTSLPLISIVKETRIQAEKNNLKRLLLLGTRTTMSSDFYQHHFQDSGTELFVPDAQEQYFLNDKIFSEIEHRILKPETKQGILDIIQKHMLQKLDGVIFGCTELPLIISPNDIDLHYLNTTQIHINALVQTSFAGRRI